jgi:SAM-dependent methyltransferase
VEPGPEAPWSDVAPDGSPAAVYLAIPPLLGFEPVLDAIPSGARVLDLGCGVGRLANHLAGLGHEVTAVDESSAMLRHVDATVTAVLARLEGLRLGRRFEVVVLASNLVNTADRGTRGAFLRAAAEHVTTDGRVLVEHLGPEVADRDVVERDVGGVGVRFAVLARRGREFDGEVTYRIGAHRWVQRFVAEHLDDDALAAALRGAGLVPVERRSSRWLVASLGDEGRVGARDQARAS